MTLKDQAVSGIRWTTFSTVLTTLMQLMQLVVLTHFLEPSAFGLMALVTVVIGFSQAFADMGITNAIIHKQEISALQLSTLYWINVLAGIAVFAFVAALAPAVSYLYNEPQLTALIIIVALTFIIQPFGQQYIALLQKEMRFNEMAKIDIVGKLVSLVVAIVLAYLLCGVYALVYATLAGVIVQTALYMITGYRQHRPAFVFNIHEVKAFLGFGVYQMAEKTINYFNTQVDTLLIGKLLGTEILGIYSVAKQLIMRPAQVINPIVTKVTFPLMAKLQDDQEKLKNIYLKTLYYLSTVNFPIYALIIIFAPELVTLLMGNQWTAAIPIIQILSLYGAIRSTGNPVGSLLLAKGKVKLGFYWNLGLFFYIPISIYAGSYGGIVGISWSLVFLALSLVIPNWYFLVKPLCDVGFMEYHKTILLPALITFSSGLATIWIIQPVDYPVAKVVLGTFLIMLVGLVLNQELLKTLLMKRS